MKSMSERLAFPMYAVNDEDTQALWRAVRQLLAPGRRLQPSSLSMKSQRETAVIVLMAGSTVKTSWAAKCSNRILTAVGRKNSAAMTTTRPGFSTMPGQGLNLPRWISPMGLRS